jgi:Fe-S-cluster-containing dehydrogenase component
MAKYGLIFDVEKCCGCYACFLACRDEFAGKDHLPTAAAQPDGQQWIRIEEIEHGTGSKVKVDYVPWLCLHCDDPDCAKNAPEGAVVKRADGIVVFEPGKSKGWKEAPKACPYGVVFWNDEAGIPQKCTLCAHMLDEGEKTTRCAECCPTGALVYGEIPDSTDGLVQVIGMPKPFIAGEVAYADRPGEPAEGVSVKLLDESGALCDKCETNFLGDFEFKGLTEGCIYQLAIEQDGYAPKEITLELRSSINVGTILLSGKEEN